LAGIVVECPQKTIFVELPDDVDWIAIEPGISSDDWPSLFDTLRNDQTVERA
jgi:hypothetical protein